MKKIGYATPLDSDEDLVVLIYTAAARIDVQGYLKLPSLTKTVYYAYVFLLSLFSVFLFGKSLLIKYAPTLTFGFFSKTGPTRQQLLEGSTKMTFYAEGWKNKSEESLNKHSTKPDSRLKLTITGPEPAYPFTAKCMVQAGLTLLKEQEKMPLKGGVLTPGVAFGKTTIQKRLEKSGLTFTLEDISCSV
ncbi:probable mitochondrial saccharopine dehydrogenase-like oxidoreductase At5g39410 [Trichonephila clavata]|uniref:Probable mitochondrial saccharopine dehydrogenase-like oxidoreductase At5g39410 n=1 Tax=Trichonephila clavata TaxID=2740835 RepID=A0A8X6GUB7_TRICU|nr:probable mitochondrial saccharopine dehydrogenase-like oxidoreductase At5g39410 [Trichonephila clavata]